MVVEDRLEEPGLVLPFSWVRVRENRAYVSGHTPSTPTARLTALAVLGSLKRALGDLDRVGRGLKCL